MSRLYRLLAKSPNYVQRFGLAAGLRLLLGVERHLPAHGSTIRSFRVPSLPGPVYLRDSISDHAVFWQCLVRCQYDTRGFVQHERLAAEYRHRFSRGQRPLIVDCGANIGLASVWFADQYPEARIYAIEPDAENVALLERNVSPFRDRVVVLRGCIWDEHETLRIANPRAGSAAFRVEPSSAPGSEGLSAYTVRDVCDMAGVSAPFIVKVDIEGAQKQLFRTNTEWVAGTSLIALELDDWQLPWAGTSRPFFSCVSRFDFDYLIAGETIFCFRDATRAVTNDDGSAAAPQKVTAALCGGSGS